MRHSLSNFAQKSVDLWFAVQPEKAPSTTQAHNTKIVAHRGNCGPHSVENTMEAFLECDQQGIWGIELDVQWTKDNVPVISHDPDCKRVFGENLVIINEPLDSLRKVVPKVPTLEEVLAKFGNRRHLMIELKRETFQPQHLTLLLELLKDLNPGKDFHLLSLELDLLDHVPKILAPALMMVALTNSHKIVNGTLDRDWPACSGHYLLFSRNIRKRLQQNNKKIGVGFISSKNSLYREIRLGADWIFTNHGTRLTKWLNEVK